MKLNKLLRDGSLWAVRIIVWSAMAVTLYVGVHHTIHSAKSTLSVIWAHPVWSDEDKIRSVYGPLYNLMLYIQRNTPEDSVIIIPPTWEDPYAGKEYFVRSFLYPRSVVSTEGQLPAAMPKRTFVLIVVENNGELWPAQPPEGVTYIEPGWGLLEINRRR